MTSSKNSRPRSGRSNTWVRLTSSCRIDSGSRTRPRRPPAVSGSGSLPQPAVQAGLEVGRVQPVAERLERGRVSARAEPVVERLERDPLPG